MTIKLYVTTGYKVFCWFVVVFCTLVMSMLIFVSTFKFHWLFIPTGCLLLAYLLMHIKAILVFRRSPCIWFDGLMISHIGYTNKVESFDPFKPLEVRRNFDHMQVIQNEKVCSLSFQEVGKSQFRCLLDEVKIAGKKFDKDVYFTPSAVSI